jgi:uncharacterized RDD family membrane protein YckC
MTSTNACPSCSSSLFEAPAVGAAMLGCGQCGGVWLDSRACQGLVAGNAAPLEALAEHAAQRTSDAEDAHGAMACPVCTTGLASQGVPGTDLAFYTCAAHGTWFKRGTLPAVARAYRAAAAPAARGPAQFAHPIASRRSRLIAATVDGAGALAVVVPAGMLGIFLAGRLPGQSWLGVAVPTIAFIAYGIVQGAGLTTRGQTIGKALEGTKVVKVDGAPAGFLAAVFLRSLAMPLAAFVADGAAASTDGVLGELLEGIACLVSLAVSADVWLILLPGRRAVHDYLAGTMVVEVYVSPNRKALARWIFVAAVTLWVIAMLVAIGTVLRAC